MNPPQILHQWNPHAPKPLSCIIAETIKPSTKTSYFAVLMRNYPNNCKTKKCVKKHHQHKCQDRKNHLLHKQSGVWK